jgi:hypothetical protein
MGTTNKPAVLSFFGRFDVRYCIHPVYIAKKDKEIRLKVGNHGLLFPNFKYHLRA